MLEGLLKNRTRLVALAAIAALLTAVWGMSGTVGIASASGAKVLLLHADSEESAARFENRLVGTGLYTAADIEHRMMTSTPPLLATLSNYDCVVVWTNTVPPAPAAHGDRLKEYVEAGGGVVLSTYALSPTFRPWKMLGGITEDGYYPLDVTNTTLKRFPRWLDFGTALTTHPILEGVSDFSYGGNDNFAKVTLDPGALLIGRDNKGVPLIAISASGQVVGINVHPGADFSKSPGVIRAYANACTAWGNSLIEVDIITKPGSVTPTPINPSSKGKIPVAILSTASFDATSEIDRTSLTFGRTGDEASLASCGEGKDDVSGDGLPDLVCHCYTQIAGFQEGDTEAILKGVT